MCSKTNKMQKATLLIIILLFSTQLISQKNEEESLNSRAVLKDSGYMVLKNVYFGVDNNKTHLNFIVENIGQQELKNVGVQLFINNEPIKSINRIRSIDTIKSGSIQILQSSISSTESKKIHGKQIRVKAVFTLDEATWTSYKTLDASVLTKDEVSNAYSNIQLTNAESFCVSEFYDIGNETE